MSLGTKEKIALLVKGYIEKFPDEFAVFKMAVREKRDLSVNPTGALKTDFLLRALYDIPETLDDIFNLNLTDEEKGEFRTKEGARWFAKTFRAFRVIEKV